MSTYIHLQTHLYLPSLKTCVWLLIHCTELLRWEYRMHVCLFSLSSFPHPIGFKLVLGVSALFMLLSLLESLINGLQRWQSLLTLPPLPLHSLSLYSSWNNLTDHKTHGFPTWSMPVQRAQRGASNSLELQAVVSWAMQVLDTLSGSSARVGNPLTSEPSLKPS